MAEMAEALIIPDVSGDTPDLSGVVTEDDTPVDNIFSEKQMRLLTEPLYTSWRPGRPFVASANVGIFRTPYEPPVVPDMFLSMDVQAPDDPWPKGNRCYFLFNYGKPPEVTVEIVSNKKGGETGKKLRKYAKIGVSYYVVFDPLKVVLKKPLRVYELRQERYFLTRTRWFGSVGLGVTLWDGSFENMHTQWLRWCDLEGRLIPAGFETYKQAEQADQRAEQERQRAEQERQRAERLAARLRELGIDPD